VVDLGYNYRIDEMRSALGRVQLGKLPLYNQRRADFTHQYREWLSELVPQVKMPFEEQRGISCYHILPVLLPPGTDRIRFMENMKVRGIQTSIHYPPVHGFHIYQEEWKKHGVPLPLTEEVTSREVTLPLYPTMSEEQVRWVVESVQQSL
jgi:dTDP-4-amino-4,6-dideoxygalactose transaminase